MPEKLYNELVILEFDKLKHLYFVTTPDEETKRAYGVTSILGVLNKPALMFWSANMAAKYVEDNLMPGKALDEIEIKNLAEGAKNAHKIK
ncbi:MAG: hypothetical protein AABY22_31655, partial [Nanoarchaeota archaeon]